MVSFRKALHYYKLILVQMREKGRSFACEQMYRCSVMLTSLSEHIVQVHTSSYRTSVSSPYNILYVRKYFTSDGIR